MNVLNESLKKIDYKESAEDFQTFITKTYARVNMPTYYEKFETPEYTGCKPKSLQNTTKKWFQVDISWNDL